MSPSPEHRSEVLRARAALLEAAADDVAALVVGAGDALVRADMVVFVRGLAGGAHLVAAAPRLTLAERMAAEGATQAAALLRTPPVPLPPGRVWLFVQVACGCLATLRALPYSPAALADSPLINSTTHGRA